MPHCLSGHRAKILAIALGVVGCLLLPNAEPAQAGGNITGYLWSATAGWISTNCKNGGTCATSEYGLNFESPIYKVGVSPPQIDRVPLTGFAWSSTLGWICFGITCDAIPDGQGNFLQNPEGTDDNYAEWRPNGAGDPVGQLYGWARLISEGSGGWISLNCYNRKLQVCDPLLGTGQLYYVAFDGNSQMFCNPGECVDPDPALGPAWPSHWAWSGNKDGSGIGWVDWSLAESDWVPPFIKSVYRPSGIYEPSTEITNPTPPPTTVSSKPGVHPASFEIIAAGVYSAQDYMIRCDILRPNGTKIILGDTFDDGPRNGSNEVFAYTIPAPQNVITPGNPAIDPIQNNTLWYIESCSLSAEPLAATCLSDSDCTSVQKCDSGIGTGVGNCRDVVFQSNAKPIYAHHNEWTLFNAEQDFYQAVKCYTGFEGEFFQNAFRCDFRGDAIFSMAMNKGIPFERECTDSGVDNDNNGKADCNDPFCRTSSGFCQWPEALECDWDAPPAGMNRCESVQYEWGDLCCTRQDRVTSGMECLYQEPEDGMFDCDCVRDPLGNPPTSTAPDCLEPYYTYGDVCCTVNSQVIKAAPSL
jgi:hypothetical protein